MSTHVAPAPIRVQDRVSDVLARDEALVDVFVRHAAHFSKLRNRAMRKVMARLVTVEQAAQMAGIGAEDLVRELNEALGLAAPDEGVASEWRGTASAISAVHPATAPVRELDVREDLRAGREPFSKIMGAVGTLRTGEVLHLRAIFEPAPLFTVLGKRGFAHESVQHAPDDWSVWFWQSEDAAPAESVEAVDIPNDSAGPANASDTVWLDVRGLEPPEPLMKTLEALESLPAGHTLVQVNVRVPQFLLPVLAERGFACDIDESRADRVLVRIWRP